MFPKFRVNGANEEEIVACLKTGWRLEGDGGANCFLLPSITEQHISWVPRTTCDEMVGKGLLRFENVYGNGGIIWKLGEK